MTGLSGDWSRLARYVSERRTRLDMTQEDVRAAGGPSTATLRNIELALQGSYKPASLARLERALHWAPGSVKAILDGGDPKPEEASGWVEPVEAEALPELPESEDELRAFAEQLLAQGRTLEAQGRTLEALGNRILGAQREETGETESKTG